MNNEQRTYDTAEEIMGLVSEVTDAMADEGVVVEQVTTGGGHDHLAVNLGDGWRILIDGGRGDIVPEDGLAWRASIENGDGTVADLAVEGLDPVALAREVVAPLARKFRALAAPVAPVLSVEEAEAAALLIEFHDADDLRAAGVALATGVEPSTLAAKFRSAPRGGRRPGEDITDALGPVTSALDEYRVLRITHITRGDHYEVGRVHARSHDEAQQLACDSGLVEDFQTFRVERVGDSTATWIREDETDGRLVAIGSLAASSLNGVESADETLARILRIANGEPVEEVTRDEPEEFHDETFTITVTTLRDDIEPADIAAAVYRGVDGIDSPDAVHVEASAPALTYPDPPADLREAWEAFQHGGEVDESDMRRIDEWRRDVEEEAFQG